MADKIDKQSKLKQLIDVVFPFRELNSRLNIDTDFTKVSNNALKLIDDDAKYKKVVDRIKENTKTNKAIVQMK